MSRQIFKRTNSKKVSHSLDKYLKEIGKLRLLVPDQECELAKKIKKGDQEALNMLTKCNLRFVVSIAKQYQNQGLPLEDLISQGNEGLIKAAKRFDEKRKLKFISYAVWWIRQSIKQAISEQSRIVRLPLNQVSSINKLTKASAQLEQTYEREPTEDELANSLEMDTDEVNNTLKVSSKHLSIEASIIEGEDSSLLDVLINDSEKSPEDELLKESLSKVIKRACNILNQKESEVLMLFFGLSNYPAMTLEEIGDKLFLTRERVRQIKEKCLQKLKRFAIQTNLEYHLK